MKYPASIYFLFALSFLVGCEKKSATDSNCKECRRGQETTFSLEAASLLRSPQLTEDNIERLKRFYPITLGKIENGRPLNLEDIKNLTRAGISDPTILYEISRTRSTFYLTPYDCNQLLHAGVSKKVIEQMRMTTNMSY